jgi:hypothetical protein
VDCPAWEADNTGLLIAQWSAVKAYQRGPNGLEKHLSEALALKSRRGKSRASSGQIFLGNIF